MSRQASYRAFQHDLAANVTSLPTSPRCARLRLSPAIKTKPCSAHIAITNLGAMNAARSRATATNLEQFEMAERIYSKSTKTVLALSKGIKRLQSSAEPSVTV
jgi:hypothetical protein